MADIKPLSKQKRKEIPLLILEKLGLAEEIDKLEVIPSPTTKEDCVSIDVCHVEAKGMHYYFTLGCSAMLTSIDPFLYPGGYGYVEVLFRTKSDIDGANILLLASGFNDARIQAATCVNNYIFFDNDGPNVGEVQKRIKERGINLDLKSLPNGGLFSRDAFSIALGKSKRKIEILEVIPVTKTELDYVETQERDYQYTTVIEALLPSMEGRENLEDLHDIKGLTKDEMDFILFEKRDDLLPAF